MRPLFALMLSAMSAAAYSATTMQTHIERVQADLGSLERAYPVRLGLGRAERLEAFYTDELAKLKTVDFGKLAQDDQLDYVLLENYLRHSLAQHKTEQKRLSISRSLLPFSETITKLEETRRRMEPIDGTASAKTLNELVKAISQAQRDLEAGKGLPKDARMRQVQGNAAANDLRGLTRSLSDWYGFYNGYDPLFSWWCQAPYGEVSEALKSLQNSLKEKVVGIRADDSTTIIGQPIGEAALKEELAFERIPYSPSELVEIAEKEYAWCEAEAKKAAKQMGFGEDWHAALEHVKGLHVKPGEQPQLIRELALEAIDFLEKRDLVTIPALAKETWRMDMMSPERQLVSPFFLGGESIIVSYPTDTMSQDAKLMSMRGNNRHFSRATVQHELIPGHHLQGFMLDRYRPYRQMFGTPFWIEGWALYWEMRLWDLGFAATPEDKMGMLFWRMHRAVRIVFSLRFHLGELAPLECVEMLVKRVGHEPSTALAEVRRSFAGDYGPLYQAAYMVGGLQFRALHSELVKSGKMTERQFHDAILQSGQMPVEWVRANLSKAKVKPGSESSWRFYETK